MFDPDVAAGGHQPLGFDQMTALYNSFYVESSSIEVDQITLNAGTNSAVAGLGHVLVWADTNLSGASSWYNAHERCAAAGGKVRRWNSTYNYSFSPLKLKASTKSILARGEDQDTSGSASADPTTQWYWHIELWSEDVSVARVVALNLKVTYNAVWSEPVALASS